MNPATVVECDPPQAKEKPDKATTKAKLGAITRELHDALRALGAAPELQRVIREIPDTRSRLSYVGDMTEKAAHRVLSLVEEAMPKADIHGARSRAFAELAARHAALSVPDPATAGIVDRFAAFGEESVSFAAQQKQVLSDIMLTQDFQDLSGQVIKKVIDMITRTERQLVQLLLDDEELEVVSPPVDDPLQGPQTPDNALEQGDVDDLLASMGF